MNTKFQNLLIYTRISLTVTLLLSLFSACASYQLGSPAAIPFQSIYLQPVANHSFAPQAQAIVSAQLREHFIRDGRVTVVATEEEADAVLFVDLTEYNRSAAARNSNDTVIANNFDVRLKAHISLFDPSTGAYLFRDRSIDASTSAYIGNPYAANQTIAYQQSERQAMTQLARQISRQISDEVLSPW